MTELQALQQHDYSTYRSWCLDHNVAPRSANGYRVKRTRLGLSNEGMLETAAWNTVASKERQERARPVAAIVVAPPPPSRPILIPEIVLLYSDVRVAEQSREDFAHRSNNLRDAIVWAQRQTEATKLTICILGNLIGRPHGRTYEIDTIAADAIAAMGERFAEDTAVYADTFSSVRIVVAPLEGSDRSACWFARRLTEGHERVAWDPPVAEPSVIQINGTFFLPASHSLSYTRDHADVPVIVLSSKRPWEDTDWFIQNGSMVGAEPMQRFLLVFADGERHSWKIPLPTEVAAKAEQVLTGI